MWATTDLPSMVIANEELTRLHLLLDALQDEDTAGARVFFLRLAGLDPELEQLPTASAAHRVEAWLDVLHALRCAVVGAPPVLGAWFGNPPTASTLGHVGVALAMTAAKLLDESLQPEDRRALDRTWQQVAQTVSVDAHRGQPSPRVPSSAA